MPAAQGGSGDVLAGFVGGLLAQPIFHGREIQAAMYATWKHGWAADQLASGSEYWGMDDLINTLGKREFREESAILCQKSHALGRRFLIGDRAVLLGHGLPFRFPY